MPGDFKGAELVRACFYSDIARVGLWLTGNLYAEYDATNVLATRAALRQLSEHGKQIVRAAMQNPGRGIRAA